MQTNIRITSEPFDFFQEYNLLSDNCTDGALVTFIGKVRDSNLGNSVITLTIEHYPGMAEKELSKIVFKARQKWSLHHITLIHRIGSLSPGDEIVFVGVSSTHRPDAFIATEFIMDHLKIGVPFWKYESTINNNYWLDLNDIDNQRIEKWK